MIFDMTKNKKIYDISPLVSEKSAVFPGDTKFSQKVHLDYEKEDNLMLSSFGMSPHVGAHADAPIHYHKDGKTIDEQDLKIYLGPCDVIDVSFLDSGRIPLEAIKEKSISTQRVLFKTNSIKNFDTWQDDFVSLSENVLTFLSTKNMLLVGLDTPSVDPSKDQELKAHQLCFERNISILENLNLKNTPEGVYNLVALPLNLKGLEASPLRAILIT